MRDETWRIQGLIASTEPSLGDRATSAANSPMIPLRMMPQRSPNSLAGKVIRTLEGDAVGDRPERSPALAAGVDARASRPGCLTEARLWWPSRHEKLILWWAHE